MILLTRQSLTSLTQRGRRVLFGYLVSLIAIASLDGFALLLLSKLFSSESLSNQSLTSTNTNSKLLVMIVFLFVLRSALSTLSTWVSLKEFADQEVNIGQNRLKALNFAPLEIRLGLNESDYFTAIDRGPSSLVQGFLVSVVTILAEFFSGLVILGVVLVVQPATAVVAFTYFLLIAVMQHKLLSISQARAGQAIFTSGNRTYDLIADYFHMNKLLELSDSKTFESVLRRQRSDLALARAKTVFISSLPRYFMESMLALGFLVIGGATWLLEGEVAVVPALAIFAAAGFRLLPIVNRIQGQALTAIGSAPLARQALMPISKEVDKDDHRSTTAPGDSRDVMEITGVEFSYQSGKEPVLRDVSLSFREGLQYAIVGPSGAGKTTLIDICLGLLTPQKGQVLWKFKEPESFFGYVPQDTHISSASIAGNVALEWDASAIDLEKVKIALTAAHLDEYVDSNLKDERLSENFNKMSGGQRQRLGLARALYRDSKLLILDEATSSLDAITESKVMETVKSLRGKTTVIIVAHRLTTIKDADQVIYLEGGKVLGVGTFTELQQNLPQFEEQVRLGLLTDE
jgi:ABC-type multidrug transport system fused ATPase/permease subunit